MRKIFLALAALVILVMACISPMTAHGQDQKSEGDGFDSPQDAAIAYLEALRDEDLPRMISTFVIESYVQNFNLEASVSRWLFYSTIMPMPNANEFVISMNIERRRRVVSDMILRQYLFLCDTDPAFRSGQFHIVRDEAHAGEFVNEFNKNLNKPTLHTIEIIGFIPLEIFSNVYVPEEHQSHMEQTAESLGANQVESCVAAFRLDGNEYLLCFDAVKYGDKWYLESLGGYMGGILMINHADGGTFRAP